MKIYKIALLSSWLLAFTNSYSQEINWRNTDSSSSHFVSINFGADYSSYYGLSYGYKIKNKFAPIVIGNDFNVSFGKQLTDDWKSRTTIQTELWHNKHFSWSLKTGFIVKRFESEIARLVNLGADITTIFGFSKPKGGIGLVIHYDRSSSTHIKNKLLKEYYPEIKDGWYKTSGGNFKFGIRGNYSIKKWNTYLNIGKTYGQNFKDNPTLPFYLDIAIQKQF